MPKYWALGAALAASFGCSSVAAQSIPDEYSKRIASHSEIGTLTGEFAGDRIDLSRGSLQIVQTDIDLPGNSALPVRVTRVFEAADTYADGHFGDWSMDLPSVHGTFAGRVATSGWEVESESGGFTENRCSSFGRPPDVKNIQTSDVTFAADDYWHGTFLHLPGSGDQELLNFWSGGHAPTDGHAYYATTKTGAVARCVSLAPTSSPIDEGEGFQIVTTDGVVYTLNQMARRFRGALGKGQDSMKREDYFLFPTLVADRFGNTVTYTWSDTNPWQLLRIHANDGRQLDFTYEAADSMRVVQVTDGSRTWHYTYPTSVGPSYDATTITLPDGSTWTSRLGHLMSMSTGTNSVHCGTVDGVSQRTGYDSGPAGDNPNWGSITGPSGATVTFKMAKILMGRSHVSMECVTDVPDADFTQARPEDPYLFYVAAVVDKTITGPGLPTNGLHWGYSYGPTQLVGRQP